MKREKTHIIYYYLLLTALAFSLQSCQGVFDDYDEPVKVQAVNGQIYIEASSWDKWYYVDLAAIADSTRSNSMYDASNAVQEFDIPMTATGVQTTTHPDGQPCGQYMYWFDIFGEGLSKNEFRYFTPTAPQPEPPSTASGQASWSFAIHRDDVRTNGGSAFETSLTDIEQVTASDYATGTFTEDEWTENKVWSDNTQMLMKLVPSQGIKINKVLSSWLTMEITTPPPTFYHNNHVFILRLADGTYGALQLADYISPETGTKCCMTIKYRYPLSN